MIKNQLALWILMAVLSGGCSAQAPSPGEIVLGIDQTEAYLPLLTGKQIGLVVNHTSLVNGVHLVDTLLARNIDIKRIFAPEHGFRGDLDAGEKVRNSRDPQTGIPVVSLYGKNYKPLKRQMNDLDYVVFDIQDVGVRCYTYISTLNYVMEACAQYDVPLLILDRPNPNAHYIDGPVLNTAFSSFVGLNPIPLVYGLTIGELAMMVNGEGWLQDGVKCRLKVIPLKNYTHSSQYDLPVKPSPNLPNQQSIALYPSLVFFEGTVISVGRGTDYPFQMIGHPYPIFGDFSFTPRGIDGMAKDPPYEDNTCYGIDLRQVEAPNKVDLTYLLNFYEIMARNEPYFNNFINLLAGTDQLRQSIEMGQSEEEIRKSWSESINKYRLIRSGYLLYPD